MTTTTTLTRRPLADPIGSSLTKAVTGILTGLKALDQKLRERPASLGEQTAELLRMADAYESTQPSYAADLRAAAMTASAALEAKSAR
ncbi:MAG: hypothetical protein AD742_18550 [Methylibium sp. NZG]|nr:MAG: hypothetical protein AD742_18550 [Methylibium sp. NZG]